MNCDICGALIGDTVYTLDDGKKYVHKCPICHLGIDEGTKPKYQRFTKSWKKADLEARLNAKKELVE